MKKIIGIILGIAVCLALAAPAMADVFVFANIDKNKTIDVDENVWINKDIHIDVDVDALPAGAAEANAVVNQKNVGNIDVEVFNLDIDLADPTNDCEPPATKAAITENTGIVGVNQASGNLNNQGNVVALAVTTDDAFTDAQASAEQLNASYRCRIQGALDLLTISAALIDEAVNNNTGIVGLNQSAGSLNNQLNTVALAAGLGDGMVALSESDLGQSNMGNMVFDIATVKLDLLTNSVNNNSGVVGVNQSSGLLNNQANVVSISAAISY